MTKETKKADAFRRQVVVKQLDDLFSIYIRLKTARDFGSDLCPICLKRPIQCCFHWVRRGHHKVRWDEGNTTGTCNGCNKGMNHDPHSYWQWFRRTYGTKAEDELIARSKGEARFSRSDLLGKLEDFKTRVENFKKNRTLVMEDKKPDNLAERNMKNRRGEEADRIADKKALVWHTEKRKISDLIPCDHNPRQMTGEQAEQLKRSIEKFNLVEIPAVNTNRIILAGHQRLRIMQMLGRGNEEIDIRIPNRPLTQAEADEYTLRSNKNIGEWDLGLLANFDDKEKSNICFTSPPYWCGFEYENEKDKKSILAHIDQSAFLMAMVVKGKIVINTGNLNSITQAEKITGRKQPALLIDWWIEALNKNNFLLRHIRIWAKSGGIMPSRPNDKIDMHWEYLATFTEESGTAGFIATFKNADDKTGQNTGTPKWAVRGIWSDIQGKARESGHCASFPVELVSRYLMMYTKPGDLSYEPYGGSGSTLIACEKFNRKCRMMEIKPLYCQVAIDRWEKFTGKQAKKIRS